MTQLVYTMYITNIGALFHLQWKENLLKYRKVSKQYENLGSLVLKRAMKQDFENHLNKYSKFVKNFLKN